MHQLKKLYSECTGVAVSSLRFLLDGRRINDEDTPKSLNMKNWDVVNASSFFCFLCILVFYYNDFLAGER